MSRNCLSLVVFKAEYSKEFVNTVAFDALAPSVARSSAGMVLTMQEKCVLVLTRKDFNNDYGNGSTKYLRKLFEI